METVKRIDSYEDNRFSKAALIQHGCFLIDEVPYEIEIISDSEGIVRGADNSLFAKLIDEFRFYAPHIYRFYNQNRELIKVFEPKRIFRVDLAQIQPSQFFVDKDKILSVRHFIHKPEDVIIQVLPDQERYISLDGHTRLYYAVMKGWNSVYAVEEKSDEWIYTFVREAMNRKIYTPMDMTMISHREYEEKWNGFCDALFAGIDGKINGD